MIDNINIVKKCFHHWIWLLEPTFDSDKVITNHNFIKHDVKLDSKHFTDITKAKIIL